jgi:hypothetical protein
MTSATSVVANLHAPVEQVLGELPDLVLGLRHGHAVARGDHDLVGVGHHDGGVVGVD